MRFVHLTTLAFLLSPTLARGQFEPLSNDSPPQEGDQAPSPTVSPSNPPSGSGGSQAVSPGDTLILSYVADVNVCQDLDVSWQYSFNEIVPDDFRVHIFVQPVSNTLRRRGLSRHRRRDPASSGNATLTASKEVTPNDGLELTPSRWTWESVNVPPGTYQLAISSSSAKASLNDTSNTFQVLSSSDTSCLQSSASTSTPLAPSPVGNEPVPGKAAGHDSSQSHSGSPNSEKTDSSHSALGAIAILPVLAAAGLAFWLIRRYKRRKDQKNSPNTYFQSPDQMKFMKLGSGTSLEKQSKTEPSHDDSTTDGPGQEQGRAENDDASSHHTIAMPLPSPPRPASPVVMQATETKKETELVRSSSNASSFGVRRKPVPHMAASDLSRRRSSMPNIVNLLPSSPTGTASDISSVREFQVSDLSGFEPLKSLAVPGSRPQSKLRSSVPGPSGQSQRGARMSNASQTTTWTVRDARDSVKRMSDHTPAEAVVASANPFARPQHSSRHLSQHRITARWSQPPMMRESSLLDDDESYMEPVEIMEAVETDLRQVKTARPVQLPSPKRLYADERSKSRSPSPTENDQSKYPQQFEDPKPVSEQQQPERSTTSALTRPNFVEGPMASAPTNIE